MFVAKQNPCDSDTATACTLLSARRTAAMMRYGGVLFIRKLLPPEPLVRRFVIFTDWRAVGGVEMKGIAHAQFF
ncbi:MAG: hypothetical protein ACYC26_08565 [Phycisphaerales bacterium]